MTVNKREKRVESEGRLEPKIDSAQVNSQSPDAHVSSGTLKDFLFPTDCSPRVQVLTALAYYLTFNLVCSLVYGCLNGRNPENAFLATVFGVLGLLVLTITFILQLNQAGKESSLFSHSSEYKAYYEYIVAGICVLVGAFTFLG